MLRLTRGRDFRLIWTAGIVSQLGDWSARLALALLVFERSGGAATVGLVGVMFVVPWLGIGQLLTAWSVRFGRRAVLMSCDGFRGLAFILIGIVDMSTPILLGVVLLAALADPVFEATKSAFITEVVPTDDYSEAIQVMHVANQASSLAGYAAGGLLVGIFGAETTLTLNGFTFLLSAALVSGLTRTRSHDAVEEEKPSLAAGLRFLRDDTISAVSFVATMITVTTAMSVESQVAVYGQVVAGLDAEGVGLLSAVTPAATLVAVALLKTSDDDRILLRRGLVTAAVSSAGAAALLSLGASGILAFVSFALVGVMFSFATMTNVVVGRRLPPENRVSIFSILQSGVFLGLTVGALLGGVISEATSPEWAAGVALAVGAASTIAAIPFVARQEIPER